MNKWAAAAAIPILVFILGIGGCIKRAVKNSQEEAIVARTMETSTEPKVTYPLVEEITITKEPSKYFYCTNKLHSFDVGAAVVGNDVAYVAEYTGIKGHEIWYDHIPPRSYGYFVPNNFEGVVGAVRYWIEPGSHVQSAKLWVTTTKKY